MNFVLPIEDTLQLPPPDTVRWAWGLDVLMAILILLVLALLAIVSGQLALFKAKATEQLTAGGERRGNVMEHFAITGEWKISEGDLPRDFATARPDAINWKSRYATTGIVDGVIVTLGKYPGHLDGTAMVTFRPAVAKGREQPIVMWLCGNAVTPAGWEGPEVSPATNLRDDHLFSMCRKRTSG